VAAIWQPPLLDSSQRLHQVGHAALNGNVRFAAPFYTPCLAACIGVETGGLDYGLGEPHVFKAGIAHLENTLD